MLSWRGTAWLPEFIRLRAFPLQTPLLDNGPLDNGPKVLPSHNTSVYDAEMSEASVVRISKPVRVVIKVILALSGIAASTIFFGIIVPILLVALHILPDAGLGTVLYFYVGSVLGLLIGGISFGVSLSRSPRIVSSYYLYAMVFMLVMAICFAICSMHTHRFLR